MSSNTQTQAPANVSRAVQNTPVDPAKMDKLIRIKTVCDLTQLGKTSVYGIPDFPKRVILSRRAVGWRLSEVLEWIASRQAV